MNSAARIEAFLEMMSAERGASDNTLSSYRRDLEDAAGHMSGRLAEAAPTDIRAYLDNIASRGFAAIRTCAARRARRRTRLPTAPCARRSAVGSRRAGSGISRTT